MLAVRPAPVVLAPSHLIRIRRIRREVTADESFAELMRKNEGGLILNIKIAAQLKRTMSLRAVHEDRDGEQNGLNRELPAREYGPRRDTELMLTGLALEQSAGLVRIDAEATARGASRSGARDAETN